ncbi:hypothetical protein OIU77_022697 [Salix suchowensis]|uniref:Arrestin-like N-terminal domain-containing protein n=1 Tax=Salix suchowensis TaxID=1278906 RepID=A0ABQ9C1Z7_9ROSI|nr:hypothetical protein OIU77_022697 [Salix suchowensis]
MMQFDLNTTSLPGHGDHHLFFKFELRSEGAIFGNKAIGEVRVPFKDLIEGFNGSVRIVNYHVRNSDEEPIGVLSFSYEVKEKIKRIDTQKLCYPVKPNYTMPPPTFPLQLSPPVAVDHGVYQHKYPSPLIQAPASYRYMKKTPEWDRENQAAQAVRPELIKHDYKVTDSNRENLAIEVNSTLIFFLVESLRQWRIHFAQNLTGSNGNWLAESSAQVRTTSTANIDHREATSLQL